MSKNSPGIAAVQNEAPKPNRNYELDFFKLFFAIMVFWTHTSDLIYSGEKIVVPPMLGRVAVHFFFILSGMFMANTISGQNYDGNEPGKAAAAFVLKKFKSISLNFIIAFLVCTAAYVATMSKNLNDALKTLAAAVPEMLFVQNSPKAIINQPLWYLSAMFLCMLPLAYMLYKKRDFTLHIFAPVTAVLLYLFMWHANKNAIPLAYNFYGIVSGGIIDAVFGLCSGICAYNIFIALRRNSKSIRILLTVTEVLLYGIFFGTWFGLRTAKTTMSVLLLLPIAIAITFSGQSYIGCLFTFKWMKCFAPLSLMIYLNHFAAQLIVNKFFAEKIYSESVLLMALFTAAICLFNFIVVKIIKVILNKKHSSVSADPKDQ